MLDMGEGLRRDARAAVACFARAAYVHGLADAQNSLGCMLESGEGVGFPFALDRAAGFPVVEAAIVARRFSLQSLAKTLRANRFKPRRAHRELLLNLNTPEDFTQATARHGRASVG